ncbi:MAG: hypothetical protein O7J95_17155, partial [Planctomycetota bacterium]|nr:hypothetical protein [Planctomycetota bacterium]
AGVVVVQEALAAFPLEPRQEAGFIVVVVATGLVALTLATLLRDATQLMLRHKQLLVPLGLLVFAEAVIGWLAAWPLTGNFLQPTTRLWNLSVAFVVSLLLWAVYGTWVTCLVLEAVREDRARPVAALAGLKTWFPRVLALEAIGWAVLLVPLGALMPLAAGAMPLVIGVIGVGSLLWNLATAALLPVALDRRLRFGAALREGIRRSWAYKGRWWKPLLAQLALLGLVTFVTVSYRDASGSHQTTNWGVNAFWVGGYENECRWYGKLMEALKTSPVALISTLLGIVFGVLAIAVKLTVVGELQRTGAWPARSRT